MSRSWKQDRTTPKTPAKNAPRPRVSDFAREYYKGKGYQVEVPEAYCDGCEHYPCDGTNVDCKTRGLIHD